jgi:hypothetical protein
VQGSEAKHRSNESGKARVLKKQRQQSIVKISHTTPSIYSSSKKPLLVFTGRDPSGLKSWKVRLGLLSKLAQVVLCHNLRTESAKLANSFGNHTFKGVGDAFPRERTQGNTRSPKP